MDVPGFLEHAFGLTNPEQLRAGITGLFQMTGVFITGIVAILTWIGNQMVTRHGQAKLRREKIGDLQRAIRAEVRGHWYEIQRVGDREVFKATVIAKIDETTGARDRYVPFIPRQPRSILLEAVISDVALLDHDTISAVMSYYRQGLILDAFIEDLRSEEFKILSPDRQKRMVSTYFEIIAHLEQSCVVANRELERALKVPIEEIDANMRGRDQTDPSQGQGGAGLP